MGKVSQINLVVSFKIGFKNGIRKNPKIFSPKNGTHRINGLWLPLVTNPKAHTNERFSCENVRSSTTYRLASVVLTEACFIYFIEFTSKYCKQIDSSAIRRLTNVNNNLYIK